MKINRNRKKISIFLIALLMLISLCACNDVSEDTTPAQPLEQAIEEIEIIADNVVETYNAEVDYELFLEEYNSNSEEYNSNSSVYLYDKNMVDGLVAESQKQIDEANRVVEETNKLVEYYRTAYGL